MSPARSPTQQAASRANGAYSRGPVTGAGKAKAARNGTSHGLRGGPFALLPGEDREEFAHLHAAVMADWSPRDAYERRWVRELVAALWRQERLRGLELATLAAAEQEHPPTEATVKRLLTFARYGARIDKDMTMALRALRVLRDRPDAHIAETQNGTSEPKPASPEPMNAASPARTFEPEPAPPEPRHATAPARTFEPEPPTLATRPGSPPAPLNRHERRRLKALERRAA